MKGSSLRTTWRFWPLTRAAMAPRGGSHKATNARCRVDLAARASCSSPPDHPARHSGVWALLPATRSATTRNALAKTDLPTWAVSCPGKRVARPAKAARLRVPVGWPTSPAVRSPATRPTEPAFRNVAPGASPENAPRLANCGCSAVVFGDRARLRSILLRHRRPSRSPAALGASLFPEPSHQTPSEDKREREARSFHSHPAPRGMSRHRPTCPGRVTPARSLCKLPAFPSRQTGWRRQSREKRLVPPGPSCRLLESPRGPLRKSDGRSTRCSSRPMRMPPPRRQPTTPSPDYFFESTVSPVNGKLAHVFPSSLQTQTTLRCPAAAIHLPRRSDETTYT